MGHSFPFARLTGWLVTAALVASALVVTAPAAQATAPVVSPGAVIVDVGADANPEVVARKYGIAPTQLYTEAIVGFAAQVTASQLASLQADVTVESVTNDAVVGRIDQDSMQTAGRRAPGTGPYVVPPQAAQFTTAAIRRIGGPVSPTADIDTVDDRRVNADIAVLDGGIDPYHPDLNVVGGYDCLPGPRSDRGWYDRDGHGTFVAGMAAAIDNGIGFVGAAPGARLWAVRVADPNGFILDSTLLCGLDWVIRNSDKIDVANLSLAGTGNLIGPCKDTSRLGRDRNGKRVPVDRIHQKICRAAARGVTVVAAAGNSSADASAFTPAAYPEVITVSAIADFNGLPGGGASRPDFCLPDTYDDTFAFFSNYGQPIDIAAPGVCLFAPYPGGQYVIGDGTSFAAPLVSGAAALIRAKQPAITPEKLRAKLLAQAEPGPIPGDPDTFREGVLNISRL